MAKPIILAISLFVSSLAFGSRPSPFASYFKQTQSGWEKVAVVSYGQAGIVTRFENGCTAVMRLEGLYNYQGTCTLASSEITYIAQLKMQNFQYILYYQAIDFGRPDNASTVKTALPRYW